MPRGTRISEPVSTGMAVSRPNSVALRFSAFRIGMPMTPNIIHTMKHTVKDRVLTASTDHARRVEDGAARAAEARRAAGRVAADTMGWFLVRVDQATVGARGRGEHPSVDQPCRGGRTMRHRSPELVAPPA
ncbi:hypothetical protein GCM10028813_18840 [Ramlibacter alkalitolerans]